MGHLRRHHQSRGAQQCLPGNRSAGEPSFYAFSFVRPIAGATPRRDADFVIAGGAEARGGTGSYPERIVRYRDLSPDGLKEKVGFTVREMESRLAAFGFGWRTRRRRRPIPSTISIPS